jgi:NTE family protein
MFKAGAFADRQYQGGPLIIIKAPDLGRGVRFSFLRDYFDVLCPDLSSFLIVRAVSALAAIPLISPKKSTGP